MADGLVNTALAQKYAHNFGRETQVGDRYIDRRIIYSELLNEDINCIVTGSSGSLLDDSDES
jgi:hypothetical protein